MIAFRLRLLFDHFFYEHSVKARHALRTIDNTSKPVRPQFLMPSGDEGSEFQYFSAISRLLSIYQICTICQEDHPSKIAQLSHSNNLLEVFHLAISFALNVPFPELFLTHVRLFMLTQTQVNLHFALFIKIEL